MKLKSVLGFAAALLLIAGFSGQAYASEVTCADIEFTSAITDVLPNANEACLGVVERDGAMFAEFRAEIVRNRGTTTRAKFQRADGSWSDVFEFTPDKSRNVRIGGRNYRMRDMQRGQQLNIYLPADRFEIAVAEDDDVATPPMTLVMVTVWRAPAVLPTTAGLLPLIGMLGGLFLALGGGLAMLRRRIHD